MVTPWPLWKPVHHHHLLLTLEYSPSPCLGELYFDKAVSGFLTELFHQWEEQACSHEVTIVFFSRIYYDSVSVLGELPRVSSAVGRLTLYAPSHVFNPVYS